MILADRASRLRAIRDPSRSWAPLEDPSGTATSQVISRSPAGSLVWVPSSRLSLPWRQRALQHTWRRRRRLASRQNRTPPIRRAEVPQRRCHLTPAGVVMTLPWPCVGQRPNIPRCLRLFRLRVLSRLRLHKMPRPPRRSVRSARPVALPESSSAPGRAEIMMMDIFGFQKGAPPWQM